MSASKQNYTFSNSWVLVVLRAFDVFLASCIWRDYNITISAWAGLEMRKPNPKRWAKFLNKWLNKLDENHCEKSIAGDIERARASLAILGADSSPTT